MARFRVRSWWRKIEKSASLRIKLITCCLYILQHWVDTSVDRLWLPEGILSSEISTSALTWFITNFLKLSIYILFLNFKETRSCKVDLSWIWLLLGTFGHMSLKLFRFYTSLAFKYAVVGEPDEIKPRKALWSH